MDSRNARNLKRLEVRLLKQLETVLKNEVSRTIKNIQSDQVDKVVYDAYHSESDSEYAYRRRGSNDFGLADTRNMIENVWPMHSGFRLNIQNHALSEDGTFEIASLVEGGDGAQGRRYEYTQTKSNKAGSRAEDYLKPRPFQQATVNELVSNKEHIRALKMGLRNAGLVIQ